MASNCEVEVTNCLLNCSIGVQEFLKSPEKEPLEVRLEKDATKKMIREKMEKNYNVKFEQVDDSLQQTILEGNDNEQPHSEPIIDIYVAGQDCATSSIKEIGATLVKRDYPKVAASLGLNDKDIGVIVVPETFIPKKARVVKPEIAEEVIQNNPEDRKLPVSI